MLYMYIHIAAETKTRRANVVRMKRVIFVVWSLRAP